jgi:hypothetical protein
MHPTAVVACWSALALLAPGAGKSGREALLESARPVVAAVVAAARDNRRAAAPAAGDDLTQLYVRAAAAAAGKLPAKQAAPAFLLALGVALDDSDLMRRNPVTAAAWKRVETDAERAVRLKVLGTPTVHGRHDLAQHFGVSCSLAALLGLKAAEAAGLLKEVLDAEEGGSGFSFADLAADLSGVHFARRLLEKPARLAGVEKGFTVAAVALSPKGLVEGLSSKEFEKRYGSIQDERFRKALEALRARVKTLPGHK